MKRVFIETPIITEYIDVYGDEFLHLCVVLRSEVGENVVAICDDQFDYNCTIFKINKKSVVLKVINKIKNLANPTKRITLFQGMPKFDKLELILQKATELGVFSLCPFTNDFCIVKPTNFKEERFKKLVVSACKQCGRSKLPTILQPVKFENMINILSSYDIVVFYCETAKKTNMQDVINMLKPANNIAIVIGSEGGFSDAERKQLELPNVIEIGLGKRILRTETASIAGIALISQMLEI
ncbi:MAG: 16S rRNA (uracil(1498)-N(3))-methyltransferase [Clostridia bacterium]